MNNKDLLEQLMNQEQELQFETFSIDAAHAIGLSIMETAKAASHPVAIDITRHGQQLFHVALEGATADNDAWIKRKSNLVNRVCHSSYLMSTKLTISGKTIEESLLLSEAEFAPHGGSFPIIIKDTGVIGTITVSGLASADDHTLVVDAIREYLNIKG
jgi:uncharacterized protein (UPF0303 family)